MLPVPGECTVFVEKEGLWKIGGLSCILWRGER
jgi:hypothetical protein